MLIRPGQLCTINNHVFRAKKKIAGCSGCFYEHCIFCPATVKKNADPKKRIDCGITSIVLVLVK